MGVDYFCLGGMEGIVGGIGLDGVGVYFDVKLICVGGWYIWCEGDMTDWWVLYVCV
jgi:hypothetical protein